MSPRRVGGGRPDLRVYVHGSADERQLKELARAAEVTVDARGCFCPEPVIRTQEQVRRLQPG